MKKILMSLLLVLGIGSAQAGLYVDGSSKLATDQAGTVTYKLTGYDAAHFNVFFANAGWVFDKFDVGDSFDVLVNPGALRFAFVDFTPRRDIWAYNGNTSRIRTTTIDSGRTYTLGFDDNVTRSRDYDFNDMQILVSFAAAVPEPETYAMFLAGLGLMGMIARRRRNS